LSNICQASKEQETSYKLNALPRIFSTLKMELLCSSETPIIVNRNTGHNIVEDNAVQFIPKLRSNVLEVFSE
jgi:uncharacterized protein (DUF2344 family)